MPPATDPFRRGWRVAAGLLATGLCGFAAAGGFARAAGTQPVLRVCADPDNMPYSNLRGEGFENRLAAILAAQLGRRLAYTWSQPRPDFDRSALANGSCDVVLGIPAGAEWAATTRPYYWSSYVLISRKDRGLDIDSLKDHQLRNLKIGVASVGGDALYSPPAHALAEAGLKANLVGYPVDGADSAAQRGRIIDAVAKGDIDIAAVWGPLAGYFAQRSAVPLRVTSIGDTDEFSARKTHFELLALQYEIAMGVRPGNDALRDALNAAIAQNRDEIQALLRGYGVPLIEPAALSTAAVSVPGASE